MRCDCASLRAELIAQRAEMRSQRQLMTGWFEMLMAELQSVKAQLITSFNSTKIGEGEATAQPLTSDRSAAETFSADLLANNHEHNNGTSFDNDALNRFKVLVAEPKLEESVTPFAEKPQPVDEKISDEFDRKMLMDFDQPQNDQKDAICDQASTKSVVESAPLHETGQKHHAEMLSPYEEAAAESHDSSNFCNPFSPRIAKVFKRCSECLVGRSNLPFSKCSECLVVTSNLSAYQIHSMNHTTEARVTRKTSSTDRFTSDTKEESVKCNELHSGQNSLKLKHQRGLTDEKPYKCDVCQQGFLHRNNLTAHLRLHTGKEKRHRCDQCDFRTTRSNDLMKHKRIHTGEKPFQCDLCDYRCSVKKSLLPHRRRIHKIC